MIEFTLNGQPQKLDVDPNMPVLWVLRDVLQLTGTKFGCGKGLCGACTVHLDGAAIRACITPVASIQSKRITTIEGLAEDSLTPVQEAWEQHNVAQCGYCQSGQIMSATALLAENANPSDEDIDNFMQGNICRCGTYQRIKVAIKSAAGKSVAIKNAAASTDQAHTELSRAEMEG